jgi:drug/metabolite transporter (DMT)-like permease
MLPMMTMPSARPLSHRTRALARWMMLALGPLALSSGSILTRLAAAPAPVVGAWRLGLATVLLAPWALPRLRREWPRLARREVVLLVLAGVALGVHFATWISSLSLTTVASSVILVNTNPIYVGLASHFYLKERLRSSQVVAIIVAMCGSLVVGMGDVRLSGQALWGDALATLGALSLSAYLLLGRSVRRKLSTLAYAWPCYGIAALMLLALTALSGQPLLGYRRETYLAFLALALVPQLLGHSTLGWALAHFSPLFITLATLSEPVGASLLAILILREVPPFTTLLGGMLILMGIYLASKDEWSDKERA